MVLRRWPAAGGQLGRDPESLAAASRAVTCLAGRGLLAKDLWGSRRPRGPAVNNAGIRSWSVRAPRRHFGPAVSPAHARVSCCVALHRSHGVARRPDRCCWPRSGRRRLVGCWATGLGHLPCAGISGAGQLTIDQGGGSGGRGARLRRQSALSPFPAVLALQRHARAA